MKIKFSGRGISTNEAYSKGYRNRHGKGVLLKTQFASLLRSHRDMFFDKFEVIVTYNGRFDIDNTVATIKVFIDVMRSEGIVTNDTKEFFKKLTVKFEPEQENPSYVFHVKEVE